MELDSLVSILGLILVVFTNVVTFTFFYGKLVSRLSHAELDIISLKHSDELHNEELKILHQIQGQLKVFDTLIKIRD